MGERPEVESVVVRSVGQGDMRLGISVDAWRTVLVGMLTQREGVRTVICGRWARVIRSVKDPLDGETFDD